MYTRVYICITKSVNSVNYVNYRIKRNPFIHRTSHLLWKDWGTRLL